MQAGTVAALDAFVGTHPTGALAKANSAKLELEKLTKGAVAPTTPIPQPQEPATATPAIPHGTADPGNPLEIAQMLQIELKRVGCDPGPSYGHWGAESRKALNHFNHVAGTNFDTKLPTVKAIEGVRGKEGRVCPIDCGKGQRPASDSYPASASLSSPTDMAPTGIVTSPSGLQSVTFGHNHQ